MTIDNEVFMKRMEAVDYKIRGYARFFSYKSQILEEDDLYQQGLLKLYERFCIEPGFIDNTDSYIWCYAAWMMKNYLFHEFNLYVKHVTDLEPEKCDTPFLRSYIPHPEPEAVRSEVRSIAEQMPHPYRTIFDAIVQGYEPEEIAEKLGISKSALKWRKHTMLEKLGKAYHVPAVERVKIIREMYEYPSVKGA
ncbi:MAG: sigma-70 family RNA polymerase sigma factor, partial [Methanotrichaceae archaeon]|nr:sigma-70 family RNA polymerase sigma factor [Methanotrichaceae archaeon]